MSRIYLPGPFHHGLLLSPAHHLGIAANRTEFLPILLGSSMVTGDLKTICAVYLTSPEYTGPSTTGLLDGCIGVLFSFTWQTTYTITLHARSMFFPLAINALSEDQPISTSTLTRMAEQPWLFHFAQLMVRERINVAHIISEIGLGWSFRRATGQDRCEKLVV